MLELCKEILVSVLSQEEARISFPSLKQSLEQIVEMKSYQALRKIKAIIEDNSLSDSECFEKIEQIVCTFEQLGSGGGNRHDFG